MRHRDLSTPAATSRSRPLGRRSVLIGLATAGGLLGTGKAVAQPETLVGYLLHCDPDDFYAVNQFHVGPFRQRMCALGWCALREARVIVRAGVTADALARSAMDLVQSGVAVIVAAGGTASSAARQATSTIPIVFTYANGPVGRRLVTSLSRPEGNITGFALMDETMAKLIEFARELFPGARAVAYLLDPTNSPEDVLAQQSSENAALAARAGLAYREFPIRNWPDIERAIAAAKQEDADALLVESSTLFFIHRFLVAETALGQRLPLLARAAQF
ncbi:MAG TPA: ABC transporter substrate binding protein, partial [Microvirga sp.]|nr:ABC transporter substrate binding protein [Microvirga sp.]